MGKKYQAQVVDQQQGLHPLTAIPTVVVHPPAGNNLVCLLTVKNKRESTAITDMRYDKQPEILTPPTVHVRKRQFLQSVTIPVVILQVFYGVHKRYTTSTIANVVHTISSIT